MLGWEVYVYRHDRAEPENLIAHWKRGSLALDWVEKLAAGGFGKDHGGTGYPWIFTVMAGAFIPAITRDVPGCLRATPAVDAITPPLGLCNGMELNKTLIRSCRAEEVLLVYVWDLS